MNLVLDVGNTRVKAAVFKEDTLVEFYVFEKRKIISEIKNILKEYKISKGIISSVAIISDVKLKRIKLLLPILVVSSTTKIPFHNLYATPKTLGIDRIVLVASAVEKYPKKNILIIDAGTCITFDFVNSKKEYLGGAISPGIKMRYKSLHHFTAKLPLVEKNQLKNFIGNTTEKSINSGVINGVCREIEGVVKQYQEKYRDLTVVLTGGDTNFLSKQLKSGIFANQNFLLEGLNKLLIFNTSE